MSKRTPLKDHLRETHLFTARAVTALVCVAVLMLAVVLRLVYLQVISHEHFTTLSENNRVNIVPIPPNRGLIFDRKGVLLAQNMPSFSLELVPEQIKNMDATIASLGEIIALDQDDLDEFKKRLGQRTLTKASRCGLRGPHQRKRIERARLLQLPRQQLRRQDRRGEVLREHAARRGGLSARGDQCSGTRAAGAGTPPADAGTEFIPHNRSRSAAGRGARAHRQARRGGGDQSQDRRGVGAREYARLRSEPVRERHLQRRLQGPADRYRSAAVQSRAEWAVSAGLHGEAAGRARGA